MSNDQPPPPDPTPPGQHQPNWGNAYPQQPPPPGQGPPQYGAIQPKHPQATTAMILGIVGLVLCSALAPFAWVIGAKAVKAIDANPAAYGGRTEANAGKIMGIIGTCLLALALLAVIVLIIVAVSVPEAFDEDSSEFFIGSLFG
ncbi:DUF4190 domain-containing protein [Aeromicrobium sp.]|uniref:DUF4190 domain-containing protein n=1 Tax=Aeromicrobium sp. TaxID=1871063 RepID=UPI0030BD1C13